ncbi:MAG TPA: hypothetical protein VKA30_01230, partial [Actinomycetota bacterium]|nr:hypothetical protein [Actinomycetota bacterium]
GDEIYARVRATDELNLTGDWVVSNTVTVGNRAPSIGSVGISPAAAYVTSTLTATPKNVFDPDGDLLVVHYVWTIDGVDLPGNDAPHLAPTEFTAGNVITVRAYVVDDRGAFSSTVTSPTRTIKWNLTAVNPVKPGNSLNISGAGYGPLERVDFKLDSPTAATLASKTTDSLGKFTGAAVRFPTPLAGGVHTLYGIGQISGTPGRGPITVIPSIKIAPTALAAGDSTLLTGVGFVPGETVTASFPLGAGYSQTSDPNGSISIAMVSPELPAPGGSVTASAPSSTATAVYTVVAKFTSPAIGVPLASVPITLTGYGALETVNAKFDGLASGQAFTTDANGSVRANLILPSTFGRHSITMAGVLSKVTKTNTVNLPATMTIVPTSGPVGTVVTIDSGPGWLAASRVRLLWGATVVQYLVADSSGKVHTTYTIPQHAPGTVNLKLNSPDLKVTASAPFTVTPAGSNQQAMYGRRRLA